jgi:hypothetical protein
MNVSNNVKVILRWVAYECADVHETSAVRLWFSRKLIRIVSQYSFSTSPFIHDTKDNGYMLALDLILAASYCLDSQVEEDL